MSISSLRSYKVNILALSVRHSTYHETPSDQHIKDIDVDEVSSAIDGVFDIGESNVESMEVRSKFGEFSYNKESVEEVVVGGGEELGVDEDELNIVISVLKDGGGELDDRLDEINLDLSHEFVIMVLESRDVSGGSLVGFLKWVYHEKNCEVFSVTSRWESCDNERRKVVKIQRKTVGHLAAIGSYLKNDFESYRLGKINQALSDVESYQLLNQEELTDGEAFLVCMIGWCIELLQAYFLLYDYIMDGSHYRRDMLPHISAFYKSLENSFAGLRSKP
ncbi:retrotransposon gag protein [Tanacetum coccineum]